MTHGAAPSPHTTPPGRPWTQAEAIALARRIEAVAPACGAHIGLTGGLLYKDGPRKDLDIVVYRIRQAEQIDREGLFTRLSAIGVATRGASFDGFVVKADCGGRVVDFMFPESVVGTYVTQADLEGRPDVTGAPVVHVERADLLRERDELREALRDALPYVEGAYECAFPDEEENQRVLARARAVLRPRPEAEK